MRIYRYIGYIFLYNIARMHIMAKIPIGISFDEDILEKIDRKEGTFQEANT